MHDPLDPAFDWRSALLMLGVWSVIVAGLLFSARRGRYYDEYLKRRERRGR